MHKLRLAASVALTLSGVWVSAYTAQQVTWKIGSNLPEAAKKTTYHILVGHSAAGDVLYKCVTLTEQEREITRNFLAKYKANDQITAALVQMAGDEDAKK